MEMTPHRPADRRSAERYIATESVMLFHHAAEMILRLFTHTSRSQIALARYVSLDQLSPRSAKRSPEPGRADS